MINNNMPHTPHTCVTPDTHTRAHARDRVITLFETIVAHATGPVTSTTVSLDVIEPPDAATLTTVDAAD